MPLMADTSIEGSSDCFAEIASLLDYPMFIVTTSDGEERSGCLIGFATQSSIDPARFLVALSDKNRTFRVASKAEHLAVHVLNRADRELAELFGEQTGDEIDKFDRCSWHEGPYGLPVLDGPRAWFVGRVLGTFATGDHVVFVLEPERGDIRDGTDRLLTFESVSDLDAGHGA